MFLCHMGPYRRSCQVDLGLVFQVLRRKETPQINLEASLLTASALSWPHGSQFQTNSFGKSHRSICVNDA